jgi:hypothetical protein
MAAWSRSAARRRGRCTLQPSRWCRIAQRWAGWWRNPVSRSIISAMRSKVHSRPANPLATPPCSSAVSIVLSWSSDSRGVGPDGPWLRSASGPPAFQAACQLLTAWRETPSSRAISPWWMPAETARRRVAGGLGAARDAGGRGAPGQGWHLGLLRRSRSEKRSTPYQPNPQVPLIWPDKHLLTYPRLTVVAAIPSRLPARFKVGPRCRRQHHPNRLDRSHQPGRQ